MENPYKLSLTKYSTHNMILQNIGTNITALDVGCNDGYIGKMSDASNKFYGLDYLSESVVKAKEKYEDALEYDLNNLLILPWNIRFDVIIFADILEHVLRPEKTLDFFIKNYLRDGGRVIISVPNIANWRIRLSLLFGEFNYTDTGIMDKTHLHFYTFKASKNLISKSRLRIIKVVGGSSFFGVVIRIFPIFRSLLATNIILICQK